ncbi:MAG: PAS domain-containing protein [Alphaproteobacteria bacterium]|nr:PAS domain-containing protein [Alphaproteobacteria bacterium]
MNRLAFVDQWRASNLPAESVLDLASVAIYATDAEGAITYFNEPAVALWGDRPVLGEARWCGSWKMFTPEGTPVPHDACPMAVCVLENRPLADIEIVVERRDGQRRQVVVNPRPLVAADGELRGAVNTVIDVTERREAERARSQSEVLARHLLESSQDCIKLIGLDGRLRSINACGCTSLEIDDPDRAVGLSYFDFWKGADREAALAAAASARATGSGRFSASYESSSGRVTVWDEVLTLLPDAAGKPEGFLVVSRDLTDHDRAAQEMAARLAQQKALSTIGAIALSEGDFDTAMQQIVELLSEATGCPMAKVLQFADNADHLDLKAGVGWHDGIVGKASVGIERASQAGYTLQAGEPVVVADLRTETRFDGPQLLIDHGVISGMSVTIAGSSARPFGVLGVHTSRPKAFAQADVDFLCSVAHVIAARWRQEEAVERRTLLLREMAHRSGNLLQLAHSVFLQTLRYAPDMETAKQTFGQRLAAMARTNMTVSHGGWAKTGLTTLAEDVLEPFRSRIKLSGRDVVLPADLCFDIGLIWHELSTNSAKYGAFSQDEGEVTIAWTIKTADDGSRRLSLVWTDSVCAENRRPSGTGFGSKLIAQLVERKHAGTIRVETSPTYSCAIEVAIAAPPEAA